MYDFHLGMTHLREETVDIPIDATNDYSIFFELQYRFEHRGDHTTG